MPTPWEAQLVPVSWARNQEVTVAGFYLVSPNLQPLLFKTSVPSTCPLTEMLTSGTDAKILMM